MIFSVVVPFRNEEEYIGKCAASLLAQDFPKEKYELIFVDNASTDGSSDIVKKHDGIKMLKFERRNVYAARNIGIDAARGQIIAFTDADCIVACDWLSRIYDVMKEPNVFVALGNVSFNCGRFSVLKLFEDCQNARADYMMRIMSRRKYYGYTNNMAVRADVFKRFGPMVEWPVPGDTEIIQRCVMNDRSCRIVYFDHMKAHHLEVQDIAIWLKKAFFYGKHNVLIKRKTLTMLETFRIYRHCFARNNYHNRKKIIFTVFMTIGDVFYIAGMAMGVLEFLLIKRRRRHDGRIFRGAARS